MPREVSFLNRNVTIVVVILVLVVIVGYLVWLRSKIQTSVSPVSDQQIQAVPGETPGMEDSSPSAGVEEATGSTPIKSGSMKEKAATSSSMKK